MIIIALLCRDQPWGSTSVIYFVIIQISAAFVALVEVLSNRFHQDSCWLNFLSATNNIGLPIRVYFIDHLSSV